MSGGFAFQDVERLIQRLLQLGVAALVRVEKIRELRAPTLQQAGGEGLAGGNLQNAARPFITGSLSGCGTVVLPGAMALGIAVLEVLLHLETLHELQEFNIVVEGRACDARPFRYRLDGDGSTFIGQRLESRHDLLVCFLTSRHAPA